MVLPVEVWVAEIIGAAVVMAAGLIATAYAQQAMGAAGMGIIGEKRNWKGSDRFCSSLSFLRPSG